MHRNKCIYAVNMTHTYQVKDLSLGNEVVEAIHDLFDWGFKVPPVHVENIDVIGSKLSQTLLDGDMHGLDVVSDVVYGLSDVGVA